MKKLTKILSLAISVFLLFSLFAFSTTAASYVGDVDGDGKVTAADARLVLRMSVGLEPLRTLEPQIAEPKISSELKYSVNGGGYFIGGQNKIDISFKPDADAASATVKILDSINQVMFEQKLTGLKKNTAKTLSWDGKMKNGSYAPSGNYTLVCQFNGEVLTAENLINFTQKNYFAGGTGSENNPFLVATKAQFNDIDRYNKACYKQTADLDFNFESAGNLFTDDAPFEGTYDGNGKKLKNIISNTALFVKVGEKGIIKNLNMEACTFDVRAALILDNYGKVNNCNINANVNNTTDQYDLFGIICAKNYTSGIISNCTVSGTSSGTHIGTNAHAYVGGICGNNEGKVINCKCSANVFAHNDWCNYLYAGGIAGYSKGIIQDCEATGSVQYTGGDDNRPRYIGGMVGLNDGQIISCRYKGSSSVSLSGGGSGVVV